MADSWQAPGKPVDHAEETLIRAILDETFPAGSKLPAERDLAARLGVTRPTLREALRRMEQAGWLDIQQGKSTRVRDFWQQGGLTVLSDIVRYSDGVPADFITNLLRVRLCLAPTYAQEAVRHHPEMVTTLLEPCHDLADTPADYARFDWKIHHSLTVASENPVFTLILNGFADFYQQMAMLYFSLPESRRSSQKYYVALIAAARTRNSIQARALTERIMQKSIDLWQQVSRTLEQPIQIQVDR